LRNFFIFLKRGEAPLGRYFGDPRGSPGVTGGLRGVTGGTGGLRGGNGGFPGGGFGG